MREAGRGRRRGAARDGHRSPLPGRGKRGSASRGSIRVRRRRAGRPGGARSPRPQRHPVGGDPGLRPRSDRRSRHRLLHARSRASGPVPLDRLSQHRARRRAGDQSDSRRALRAAGNGSAARRPVRVESRLRSRRGGASRLRAPRGPGGASPHRPPEQEDATIRHRGSSRGAGPSPRRMVLSSDAALPAGRRCRARGRLQLGRGGFQHRADPPPRGDARRSGGGDAFARLRSSRAVHGAALRLERQAAGDRPVRHRGEPQGSCPVEGVVMKQVLLRDGKAVLEEVPAPSIEPGAVLVRTAYSVLSAGTERAALRSTDEASLLGRAKDPASLGRAFDVLRREGPGAVWDRLRSATEPRAVAPGYSASGLVQAAGPGVFDLPPGQAVACAGAGRASHAEWISVPRNLAVAVPPGVPLDEAAFTTLGSVALQGVRRSGIQIGECAAVLGLGIIGVLTAQLLRVGGARVIAFDVDPDRAARARDMGFEAYDFGARDPREEVTRVTRGLLADAVVVCAHSPAAEAANLAMRLCRRKGRGVIVGDVRLDLDRALLYEKELDLLISTSYGPGRYDPSYEDKGIDYPAPYVRFTLNRNMESFLDLVRAGRIALRALIDRVVRIGQAASASEAIEATRGAP